MTNNGHGVVYVLNFANGQHVTITGGPLKSAYVLHSFHMHWPSEHTVNGIQFQAELHLVHFKSDYRNLTAAKLKHDGLAVLSFFYDRNSILKKPNDMFNILQGVRNTNTTTTVTRWNQSITKLVGPERFSVYNYQGSITSPTCNEVVTWMVNLRFVQ